jgi:hypothetical protein
MSEPLKLMQIEYLKNSITKCFNYDYNKNYSRYEQIMVCKETERQKVWGKFDLMHHKYFEEGSLKY